ncbi:MAG: polyprenyl synthetase family protein, partial [Planctomycetota bacterium]
MPSTSGAPNREHRQAGPVADSEATPPLVKTRSSKSVGSSSGSGANAGVSSSSGGGSGGGVHHTEHREPQAPTVSVENHLKRAIARDLADLELPANLVESVEYSLLAPGKRLRPHLVWHSCAAVGGDPFMQAPSACIAIEMIHCFSLIHDDLPAMDDDDLRRGRPTNHVKYGEAMAILAGDALATLPYLLLSRAQGLSDEVRSALVTELASGTARMIAGQVYDTLGGFPDSIQDDPEARIQLVDRNKTGALIRGACRMGAIAGGADEDQLAHLTEYGRAMGFMFQIVDDVLDVTQTDEQMGKRTHKDEAAGKLTYPGVFGLEESRRRIEELRRSAISAVATLGDA